MTEPDPFAEAKAAREAIRKEYGSYVAVVAIDIHGGRAFNPGDPVPASHVDNGLVDSSQVVGAKTKTAAALTEKD